MNIAVKALTRRAAPLWLVGLLLAWLAVPVAAYHFPWDQGHDTTDWDDPTPPGPCEGENCDPCNSGRSPVYVPTGHFVWTDTDITLKGRPGMSLARTYNSHDPRDGMFGNGWVANCEPALIETTESGERVFVMRLSNGKRYTYRSDGSGVWVAAAARFDKVTPEAEGGSRSVELDGSYRTFDGSGRLTAEVDPNGNALRYEYEEGTGLLRRLRDDNGRYFQFDYNSGGRVAQVTDHAGRAWGYGYDVAGNLTSVTDPLGGVRRYEYQAYHPAGEGHTYQHLTRITDPSGVVVTQVTYNGERVASYTVGENRFSYSYSTSTKTVTKTDSVGSRWTFVYNDEGLITQETDPRGHRVTHAYDSNGREVQRVDELGQIWSAEYDVFGRLMSRTNPLREKVQLEYAEGRSWPWASEITSPSGRRTVLEYDGRGNLVRAQDPLGAITELQYTPSGHPRRLVHAMGEEYVLQPDAVGLTAQVTDPLGRTSSYEYDSRGNVVTATDPMGQISRTDFDVVDRVTRIVDKSGVETLLQYDAAGRLLTVQAHGGATTHYGYDQYGRLSSRSDPAGYTRLYRYRGDNLLESIEFPDGRLVTFEYDLEKRLIRRDAAGYVTTYTYTPRGRLNTSDGPWGGVSRSYDEAGRLVAETINGSTISSQRNKDGERVRMTALGRSTLLDRDQRGYITRINSPEGVFQFSYDIRGRRTELRYPDESRTQYLYDVAGQLQRLTHDGPFAAILSVERDLNGRITRLIGDGPDWQYEYDMKGRLVRALHGTEEYRYTYDARNNRIGAGQVYDDADRLLESEQYRYVYDANGYLRQREDKTSGTRTHYTWNLMGQLLEVGTFPDSVSTLPARLLRFEYGPLGRRLAKSQDGVLAGYFYDKNDLIAILDATGSPQSFVTFGPRLDEPLAVTNGDGLSLYRQDHNGSVWAVTRGGTVVSRLAYAPFGVTAVTGSESLFSFTGRVQDADDLYYFRARYYNPATGRFISPDPLGLEDGVNLYAYAHGDPVNMRDPFGTSALAGALPWAGGAAAADGPLPIGDAIAIGIIVGVGIYDVITWMSDTTDDGTADEGTQEGQGTGTGEGEVCPVPVPNDPTQSPGEDWEWRGNGPPGSDRGSWYNPKTGESMHPDLNHPDPVGPHWDYIDPSGRPWRVDPGNGNMTPK